MDEESRFIKECKSLESSKNFQEIVGWEDELSQKREEVEIDIDSEKFKKGAEMVAKWLGKKIRD